MKIETLTFIEVQNEPNIWAIILDECKEKMGPVIPKFISVHNDLSDKDIIYVDNTLLDSEPEKIIQGITGSNAEGYIDVGFWRIKYKADDYPLSA